MTDLPHSEPRAKLIGLTVGAPAWRTTPRPFWTCRGYDRETRTYTVAVVVCAPVDAMAVLHPDHKPGQTIVAPHDVPAYRAEAWARAWSVPLGEIVTFETSELPTRDGQWIDR